MKNLKKVCFDGKGTDSRKNLIAKAEKMGYEYSEIVTSDLNILVVEIIDGVSSKKLNAKKYNIKIVTYSEFFGK